MALRNQRDQLIWIQENSYGCEAVQRREFARNPVQSLLGRIGDHSI
jgi:hypothetical protein